jgi:DNA replication and repair protein RecF
MYVSHLSLTNFRSYDSLELPLAPGISVFVGPNGQGKTNLVEAIGYLATLTSHRVANDAPLVRIGAERAVIRGVMVRDARPTLIEVEINPGKANRARINRSPVPRAREILGLVRTVAFAPEDIVIVKGDPAERRRFLDDLLVTRLPRYAGVRADYERVLKQRNALLKSAGIARGGRPGGADLSTLDVWNAHLARFGAELLAGRLELIELLRPLVAKAYDEVARDGGDARLDYRSSLGPDTDLAADRAALAGAYLDATRLRRREELDRGTSLVGPHRDELLLSLGGMPTRGYASHGECWSFALALRLASYELLRSDGGEPVLVLDDVFAELDVARRDRLAELVATAEQVLVTAAVSADVPQVLSGTRFEVLAGTVRPNRAGE